MAPTYKAPQGTMSFLAWNYRGSGGNPRSSKMTHLACLIVSTKEQRKVYGYFGTK